MGAMLMRLGLLASIAWVVKLYQSTLHRIRSGDLVSRPDPAARWPVPDLESE